MLRAEVARMFNTDPHRMRQYPAREERRMTAYYLKVTGRMNKEQKDGEVTVEHFGDVREDDPSVRILEG